MMINELENELRGAFAGAAAGIEVPEAVRERLRERNYRLSRLSKARASALGAVALAAAAAVAVPLAVAAGPARTVPGATLRLASYSFTMPSGYRAVHGRPACAIAIGSPPAPSGSPPKFVTPKVPAQVRSAASAHGGCIRLLLLPAYRPARGTRDPYALPGARSLRVGGHRALLYKFRGYTIRPDARPVKSGMFELFVRVPARGGKVRDLAVGSNRLTERELVRIVANGLVSRKSG